MEIDLTKFLDFPIKKPADDSRSCSITDLNLTLALPYYAELANTSIKSNDDLLENKSKRCSACGKSDPTTWRKGPDGPKTLCNACGLRYLRNERRDSEKSKMERIPTTETRELGSLEVVGRSKRLRKRTRKSFP